MSLSWRIALWAAIVLAALGFLYLVRSIVLPFVLGWIIAVLLDPVVDRIVKRGLPRPIAASGVMLVFLLVGGLAILAITPAVTGQLRAMASSVQELTNQITEDGARDSLFTSWNPAVRAEEPGPLGAIDRLLAQSEGILGQFNLPTTRSALVQQYIEPHREELAKSVELFFNGLVRLLGSAASSLFMLAFTPLFAFMFLIDLDQFRGRVEALIPPTIRSGTMTTLRQLGDVLTQYLRGVAIGIAVYGVYIAVLLTLVGAPNAIVMGLLAAVLYLVPFLGPWIVTITAVLVTGFSGQTTTWYMTYGSPWSLAIVLFVVMAVMGTAFDQAVYPRIVGRAIGLHPLVCLFVVFAGGALFGIVGMLLAYPVAGCAKLILEKLLRLTGESNVTDLKLPAVPLRHRSVP